MYRFNSRNIGKQACISFIASQSIKIKEKTMAKTHTVKSGDTLFKIAEQYYGDGNQWNKIASANGNLAPESLKVGQKITIPD